MTTATLSQPIWRGLAAAGILATAMSMGTLSAAAGECPADQVVADGNGQKTGAHQAQGRHGQRPDAHRSGERAGDAQGSRTAPAPPRGQARRHRAVAQPHRSARRSSTSSAARSPSTAAPARCRSCTGRRVDRRGEGHLALVEEHRQEDRRAAVGRSVPRQGRPARDVSVSPDGWSMWLPQRAHALPFLEGDHTPAPFFTRSRTQVSENTKCSSGSTRLSRPRGGRPSLPAGPRS